MALLKQTVQMLPYDSSHISCRKMLVTFGNLCFQQIFHMYLDLIMKKQQCIILLENILLLKYIILSI